MAAVGQVATSTSAAPVVVNAPGWSHYWRSGGPVLLAKLTVRWSRAAGGRQLRLSVLLDEPEPSGSAGPSRRRQSCSRPPPRFQGQAALSFIEPLRQPEGGVLPTPLDHVAPRGAQCSADAHVLDLPVRLPSTAPNVGAPTRARRREENESQPGPRQEPAAYFMVLATASTGTASRVRFAGLRPPLTPPHLPKAAKRSTGS